MTEFDVTSLFSTDTLHRRDIKACGIEFPVFVRRVPAIDLRRFVDEQASNDREERLTAGFNTLVKAIRKEDGTAFATFDEYRKMEGEAIAELIRAFREVNTPKKDETLGNA